MNQVWTAQLAGQFLLFCSDGRMQDCFQRLFIGWMIEYPLAQPATIQSAIRGEYSSTESGDDVCQRRLPGLHQCTGQDIKINDGNTQAGASTPAGLAHGITQGVFTGSRG